jgi:glycosyltransferase involved in cell wall biosynthesis
MNKEYAKDFSVIVPVWRGAVRFLPKLFDSIPEKDGIEIIVVDNSKELVSREEIDSQREITLLHSAPERHAGGSRNDGMAVAKGKWLLFADADDFYTQDAFDIYYEHINTDAEIVYTGMGGIYEDTGEPSDRGDKYIKFVHDYCIGAIDEMELRIRFSSPCCKMVSHALVDREQLRYDEIRAGNDIYFSLTSGFYAKKIDAVDKVTYIATVNRGSLMQRRDFEVIYARLYSKLHCNQFLKKQGLSKYQHSIMVFLFEARKFGLVKFCKLMKMVIRFKQNPFIGFSRWFNTFKRYNNKNKKNAKYIVYE